ncbi:hypothetical protein KEM56_002556 [Ascosphaera pollenicola]|nr:hypothetical protein KEM56_002556 [Ascosphaera pollenicola]
MPPRKTQTRSRTGPLNPPSASSSSIRAISKVTKPTRSASERAVKSKQLIADSLGSPGDSQIEIQIPSTPPSASASSKEPKTPLTSRTKRSNGNHVSQNKAKGNTPLTPKSPAVTPDLAPSTQATNAINAQAKEESKIKYDTDEDALRMPEAQIRKYWKGIEERRITPQIHQEGVSLYEKILRHFDLTSKYGPCIGIARIRRWRRAQRFNLDPPMEVLAVLLKLEERGEPRQMAYIDALLS